MSSRLYSFVGGISGAWRVVRTSTVVGEPIAPIQKLEIIEGTLPESANAQWVFRGVASNERYVTRAEKTRLLAQPNTLGQSAAVCAALIPIRKSAAWWALAQDERRKIFEESSKHVATGLRYIPAIARRLHHCRDLGTNEPFDFLTWFEYAPADAPAFDRLVAELRASEEWTYVDREIDIRLMRDGEI